MARYGYNWRAYAKAYEEVFADENCWIYGDLRVLKSRLEDYKTYLKEDTKYGKEVVPFIIEFIEKRIKTIGNSNVVLTDKAKEYLLEYHQAEAKRLLSRDPNSKRAEKDRKADDKAFDEFVEDCESSKSSFRREYKDLTEISQELKKASADLSPLDARKMEWLRAKKRTMPTISYEEARNLQRLRVQETVQESEARVRLLNDADHRQRTTSRLKKSISGIFDRCGSLECRGKDRKKVLALRVEALDQCSNYKYSDMVYMAQQFVHPLEKADEISLEDKAKLDIISNCLAFYEQFIRDNCKNMSRPEAERLAQQKLQEKFEAYMQNRKKLFKRPTIDSVTSNYEEVSTR